MVTGLALHRLTDLLDAGDGLGVGLDALRLLDRVQAALDSDAGPGAGAAAQGTETKMR